MAILFDILSAILASKIGKEWSQWYNGRFSKKSDESVKNEDLTADFFLKLWLFNPITIGACLAQSSQIFYNYVTLAFLYTYQKRPFLAGICLAILSVNQIYPVQYLVPFLIYRKNFKIITTSTLSIFVILAVNHLMNPDAIPSIYKYILTCPDYSPNTGIFWYLVAEMFEHFRAFFLAILQINVFIYAIPLSFRFQQLDTNLVLWMLIGIQAAFKSYSTLTDLVVPLVLLPAFNANTPFRKASFIAYVAFFICASLSPIMWSQWVLLGRGNANFFFATSLGIVICMALIITDVMLGHFRLEYIIKNKLSPDTRLNLGEIKQ